MAPVWAELAGVDMQVGDWKAAVAHYARAAFLDPSDRDIRAGFRRVSTAASSPGATACA